MRASIVFEKGPEPGLRLKLAFGSGIFAIPSGVSIENQIKREFVLGGLHGPSTNLTYRPMVINQELTQTHDAKEFFCEYCISWVI